MCAIPVATFFLTFFLPALGFAMNVYPLATGAAARPLARTRVGLGALTANGQTAAMPQATVGAEVHLTLDVHRDVATKVTFDAHVGVEILADALDVAFREFLGLTVAGDTGRFQDLLRLGRTDSIDVAERNTDVLTRGKIDACNTGHDLSPQP